MSVGMDTRFSPDAVQAAALKVLREAGASAPSAGSAVRAMMHASLVGVDSHGIRLTEHYCRMLRGGRINGHPALSTSSQAIASAMLNGDDGLGHHAAYKAVELAVKLANYAGIGAVGVERSSHFGAAGAYALAGAELGCLTFVTTNTDSMVALFDGAAPFHGTNPLAYAAPVPEGKPWLLDMATSSIPMNRVLLNKTLGIALPPGVAANSNGNATCDPARVDMLLPLGGADFGYKGAALAGVATLFSAILTGTTLDMNFIPMYDGGDSSTPRNMGHFVMAIDPDKFAGREGFGASITSYLASLRSSPVRVGGKEVLAPGDREWREMELRLAHGIPLDSSTATFLGLF